MPRVETLSHSDANLVASAAAQQVIATPHPESPVIVVASTDVISPVLSADDISISSPAYSYVSLSGLHGVSEDGEEEDRHSDSEGFVYVEDSDDDL